MHAMPTAGTEVMEVICILGPSFNLDLGQGLQGSLRVENNSVVRRKCDSGCTFADEGGLSAANPSRGHGDRPGVFCDGQPCCQTSIYRVSSAE